MSTRPYDFIPCRHPEHPHKGRNTFHGPCQAKIDKEGNICGWEPTEDERQRVRKQVQKEDVVKVKGEPLKKAPKEQAELAPEGETATVEVDPASEVPGTIEEFAEMAEAGSDSAVSDEDEKPEVPPADVDDPTEEYETDQGYCAEHSKLVKEFGPCLGNPEDPCLRTCHAWMPPRPEPVPTVGWCKQRGEVTMVDTLEGGFCGCSELDSPAMCTIGCPDWLNRPEGAPECWGSTETPADATCRQDDEECGHMESCLQATLALLAATGPTEGWCAILERKVELGDPCDATEPEMTCLNNCEYFQPLPEESEEVGRPTEYPVYTPVPRRRYAVVDADTGEALQLSLLGAQWEDYRVKSERWSLSGGDETSQKDFEDCIVYRGRELRPGTVVEVVCRGYVKERAPIFKKDVYEGKTVIVIESLVEIELLGYRGGPIEVALNVDGEPKVYDEPKESESTPELETSGAVDWTGETEVEMEIVEDEEPEEADPDGIDFGGDVLDNLGVEDEG